MKMLKPAVVVASVLVATGLSGGITSVAVSQGAKPDPAQHSSDMSAKAAPVSKNKPAPRNARPSAENSGRSVHVAVPTTTVDVRKDSGRVRISAPYTNVKVDPDRGQVRVRAPYVDLNIRW
jgi:hypothetical protein